MHKTLYEPTQAMRKILYCKKISKNRKTVYVPKKITDSVDQWLLSNAKYTL